MGRGPKLLVSGAALLATVAAVGFGGALDAAPKAAEPIRLHPANANYFLFRGRPTLLIASGEHYGALVNLDFDYARYFDALREHGFNVTRVFTGSYVEWERANPLGHENTLAPRPGRFLAPWARSETPGYRLGGAKFDLERWDEAYFGRLRSLVGEAGRRGIVVELTLFSVYYGEEGWRSSPLHPSNNINGVGVRDHQRVYRVAGNEKLLRVQDRLVRKLVHELRGFDNVIFEVLNEPWAASCDYTASSCGMRRWQERLVSLIWSAENGLPRRHLISENVGHGANALHGSRNLELHRPNPRVSIYQYHYAEPHAARANLGLRRALGNNETGFRGLDERPYRAEAWQFLLAGGGLFNGLDWSFTTDEEDGGSNLFRTSFASLGEEGSSGGAALRAQLAFLKRFLTGLPFLQMRPDGGFVVGGVPSGVRASVLGRPGRAYAVYVPRGPIRALTLRLPPGRYRTEWFDPVAGLRLRAGALRHGGGTRRVAAPRFSEDVVLALRRQPG
jgi:hypothetical protein